MFEAWLFALAYRVGLAHTVDFVLSDLFSIFAFICAQRSAVECRHLISCARSSKYCRFMVTNIGKVGTFAGYSCFFTMDLFCFEEIVSGNDEYQEK